MSPEQELLTKWRSLPQDKQEEVLDFVEFLQLKIKLQEKEKIQPTTPEGKGWNSGFFEEVIGGWVGEPLKRPEQGEKEPQQEIWVRIEAAEAVSTSVGLLPLE
ncbi:MULTISPECIES: DUF2281 domain-containing protein [unclassified Nostoc]|uniref:DUF2281 domain-containing protein n=1 Tax=unclassified Nostoc TaxID=2593658 RepID=UPI0025FB7568|nr:MULTISPECIES: DUF2281 domain-containing protein [unclassified Nostoc]